MLMPLDLIDFDESNPQEEDPATFNDLVLSMEEDGITENVVLRTNGDRFMCVSGEHRVKAARLAGPPMGPFKTIPARIREDWDEDAAAIRLVRMNALHGKINADKFTSLYGKLKSKYSEDELRRMLGFSGRDAEMKRLIKTTVASMPERMQAEIEKRSDQIRTVEDLAATVQALFTRYGGTIDQHFVLFAHGGMTHLMVRCTPQTFAPIEALVMRAESEGKLLDEVLAGVVEAWLREQPEMKEPESDDDQ